MNDDEAKALGLRAVACPGWRWMRGMVLGPDGWQVVTQDADALASDGLELAHRDGRWSMDSEQVAGVGPFADDGPRWPDFRDPATLGCLLALVRDAWRQPYAVALAGEFSRGIGLGRDFKRWSMRGCSPRTGEPLHLAASGAHGEREIISGATEAEALVAALEAAVPHPKRESENA